MPWSSDPQSYCEDSPSAESPLVSPEEGEGGTPGLGEILARWGRGRWCQDLLVIPRELRGIRSEISVIADKIRFAITTLPNIPPFYSKDRC